MRRRTIHLWLNVQRSTDLVRPGRDRSSPLSPKSPGWWSTRLGTWNSPTRAAGHAVPRRRSCRSLPSDDRGHNWNRIAASSSTRPAIWGFRGAGGLCCHCRSQHRFVTAEPVVDNGARVLAESESTKQPSPRAIGDGSASSTSRETAPSSYAEGGERQASEDGFGRRRLHRRSRRSLLAAPPRHRVRPRCFGASQDSWASVTDRASRRRQ